MPESALMPALCPPEVLGEFWTFNSLMWSLEVLLIIDHGGILLLIMDLLPVLVVKLMGLNLTLTLTTKQLTLTQTLTRPKP